MNTPFLIDEKNNHIIMISSGPHEMSFKRYFVKEILNLNTDKISDEIYQSDKLLNEYLSVHKYTGHCTINDYKQCYFSPIKDESNEKIFPKNVNNGLEIKLSERYKFIRPINSHLHHFGIEFEKYVLNKYRITMIIQDPYERLIYLFYIHFVGKKPTIDAQIVKDQIFSYLKLSYENCFYFRKSKN